MKHARTQTHARTQREREGGEEQNKNMFLPHIASDIQVTISVSQSSRSVECREALTQLVHL